jgi:transcription initiation factor TFIIE subunit beta
MALNASLNSFKAELAGAASRNAQYSRPSSSAPTRTATPKPGADGSAKRSHDTAFTSQPSNTPAAAALASRNSGSELMTQVITATQYLREKSPAVVPFEQLISYLSLPNDSEKNIPLIRHALIKSRSATRFLSNESGNGKESFKYKPIYPITNGEELKDYLATLGQQSASGIQVKDLKDGWPDCVASLDKLENEGFLLITRWKKDSSPRVIYPDSPSYHILNSTSGLPQKLDADFMDVWNKTKLPGSEIEIRNELEKAGLTPTSQVREVRRGPEVKRKEKRRVNRKGGKTTNAHMLGILKDYSKR